MTIETQTPFFSAPLRLCVRFATIAALLAASSTLKSVAADDAEPLRKAADYLWTQQADDGGWHSEQYAVLRSGQALTPFVLHTLLTVPETICPRPEGGVERALDFIRKHIDEQGALGHADPDIAEYPVYSTAYAIRCLRASGTPEDFGLADRMETFLRSAQLIEANGFTRRDAAYGGWGFDAPLRPGEPGHMDLAHTRRVLEAISRCPKPADDMQMVVLAAAQRFLMVVQKQAKEYGPFDGGFYFSPVVLAANKGREGEKDGTKYFHSYATATCDGILALLAADVPRDDERIVQDTIPFLL
jgi:hypothetical protein